jgi:transposase
MVNEKVAGIDVSKPEMVVCVCSALVNENVRTFGSFTRGLEEMAEWLVELGVLDVAMEATGPYWKALYRVLSSHRLTVTVFMPGTLRSFHRHKTDVLDCQWIWRLHAQGNLKDSYIPAGEVAEVRGYDRWKSCLAAQAADCARRMSKALVEMNYRLDLVLSDILGKSGLAMIEAILGGERDPERLAAMRDHRVKASKREVRQALEGVPDPANLLVLRQALAQWRLLGEQTEVCEGMLLEVLERLAQRRCGEIGPVPYEPKVELGGKKSVEPRRAQLLTQIYGVDITQAPGIGTDLAVGMLGECGYDLDRWRDDRHFTSWCRVSPSPRITGGKPIKGRHRRTCMPRSGRLFLQAAVAAGKTETMVGARHRRLRRRLSPGKAVKATARWLAATLYAMVTRKTPYVEIGVHAYEALFAKRRLHKLKAAAARLGMDLVPRQSEDCKVA